MSVDGYTNEYNFVVYYNGKKVGELDPISYDMFHKIFYNIKDDSIIRCWRNHNLQKGDILINVDGIIKSISIKCGSKNSVHAEHIYYFKNFLKESGISYKIISIFNDYHYAKDEYGNRISSQDYKTFHAKDIIEINNSFNNTDFINKCIDRFILKGTNCDYKVSGIIYGTPKDFLFISKNEIRQIILSKANMETSGVHVGPLFIQPMARNFNNNPKHEKYRHIVQVKWFSLFDDMMQMYYDKNSIF